MSMFDRVVLAEAVIAKFDDSLIANLRKDYLLLMKNVPRVKDERTLAVFAEGARKFLEYLEASFTAERSGILGAYYRAQDAAAVTGNRYATQAHADRHSDAARRLDKRVRGVVWDLMVELRDVPGYARSGSKFHKWAQESKRWKARADTKARELWKELAIAAAETRRWGSQTLSVPGGVSTEIEGVPVKVDTPDGSLPEPDLLKAGFRIFDERARRTIPWLAEHKLPIIVKPLRWVAATYEAGPSPHINWNSWMQMSQPREVAQTYAHELAHHLYKSDAVHRDARALWNAAIDSDKERLDLVTVLDKWPDDREYLWDFADSLIKTDPKMSLQLGIVRLAKSATTDVMRDAIGGTFSTKDELRDFIKRGNTSIVVPSHPITSYGSKDAEEAFCEAVALLVAYGPMTLHPAIRNLLKVALGSKVRIEQRSGGLFDRVVTEVRQHEPA